MLLTWFNNEMSNRDAEWRWEEMGLCISTYSSGECSHVTAWYLHYWAAMPIFFSLAKPWASSDGAPRGSVVLFDAALFQQINSLAVTSALSDCNGVSSLSILHVLPCLTSTVVGRLFVFSVFFFTFCLLHICASLSVCHWYRFSFSLYIIHPYFACFNVSIHKVLESILSCVRNPHHSSGKLCLWW